MNPSRTLLFCLVSCTFSESLCVSASFNLIVLHLLIKIVFFRFSFVFGKNWHPFDSFYETVHGLLNQFYPERTVSMTSREPAFMHYLSVRIGGDIMRHNTAQFTGGGDRVEAKDLWDKVRQLSNRGNGRSVAMCDVTATELKTHYAAISSDQSFTLPVRKLC